MTVHYTNIDTDPAVHASVGDNISKSTRSGIYRSVFKRALDLTIILVFAPVVLPIIAIMALMVCLDGHNPFYSQSRVGKNGRHFRLWKIRTMTPNAENLLANYLKENPDARAEWDLHQKLKSDPRITHVGHFLRKASLDELPQLLNVVTGSMSLVGPRPMMLDQEACYHGSAYYRLRPGITGLWQTSDRNESSFIARVRFDEEYDRTLSFKTDVITLLRTVSVVLRGTGY